MITVYADVLFLINFAMIFGVFLLLRMFFKKKRPFWLCALGAAFGSFFYEVILFCGSFWALRNPLGYEGLIFVSSYIAFLPKGVKESVKAWALVNLLSLFAGGLCMGVFYFSESGGYVGENIAWAAKNVPVFMLVVCCGFCYIIIRAVFKAYENRIARGREYFEVEVLLNGCKAVFKALGDTGNVLRDPLNGRAVIVGEPDALKSILPDIDDLKEDALMFMEKHRDSLNMSLVPFRSLGRKDGVLFCFLPDKLSVDGEAVDGAEIGVSPEGLSSDGSFKGLLNIDIVMKGEGFDVCGAA